MGFVYGAATDAGLRRKENEDRYLADGAVFAVADGLGGHADGAKAAAAAVGVLGRAEPPGTLDQLISLVGIANTEIYGATRSDPALRHMSTTLCALATLGEGGADPPLGVVNVGDSRLYALVSGDFAQLTVDHTIVENLLRDGVLTQAEAVSYKDRHVLTRAVGYEPRVLVDGWELRTVLQARFLICSDGLTNEVPDYDIAAMLACPDSPADVARRLVEAAVQPGRGRDNATVVVVDVDDPQAPRCDSVDGLVLRTVQAVAA